MAEAAYYLFLTMALLLPLLLLKLKKPSAGHGASRLPPGPWRLPVIGSLHHLLGKPHIHRALADLAHQLNDAPLMYLKLGDVPIVVATSPDAAREVLKTNGAAFSSRPRSPTIETMMADGEGLTFAPYGELWRKLRRITVTELLSARRVGSLRRVREDEVAGLVAAIAATPPNEQVNVSERVAALVTNSVVRAMVGDGFERQEEFLEMLREGLAAAASVFSHGDLFPSSWLVNLVRGAPWRARENHRKNGELWDWAIEQHEERRREGKVGNDDGVVEESLVDVLLRMQKEDGGLDGVPLSMGTVKALIIDLFVGGSGTTATTLQWAMSELMRNPNVMTKAQAELRHTLNGKPTVTEDDLVQMKYLKLIIKETLRLHPPGPLLLPRESTASCKILGYDVSKGSTVLVNAWAIGRDPKYWEDAEVFRPERFECSTIDFMGSSFEYLPFGAGRRICPGMTFAQRNIELTLAALLYHFDWKLPNLMKPSELDMTEEMGLTIRRKNDLKLLAVICVPLQSAK